MDESSASNRPETIGEEDRSVFRDRSPPMSTLQVHVNLPTPAELDSPYQLSLHIDDGLSEILVDCNLTEI